MTTLTASAGKSIKAYLQDPALWRMVGSWAVVGGLCVLLANTLS